MEIKLLILDVDGTLTDAKIYFGNNHIELKAFSAKDGAVLKVLSKLGIEVILLTGRKSEAVSRRAADLDILAIQGIPNKAAKLLEIFAERNLSAKQTAYIGDDINDYAAMKICSFKACPADSAEEIKAIADYISPKNGGQGAVRDICEFILKSLGKWEALLSIYGFGNEFQNQ